MRSSLPDPRAERSSVRALSLSEKNRATCFPAPQPTCVGPGGSSCASRKAQPPQGPHCAPPAPTLVSKGDTACSVAHTTLGPGGKSRERQSATLRESGGLVGMGIGKPVTETEHTFQVISNFKIVFKKHTHTMRHAMKAVEIP